MVGELLPAPYHSRAAPNGLNVPDSSRCSDGTSLMTEDIWAKSDQPIRAGRGSCSTADGVRV